MRNRITKRNRACSAETPGMSGMLRGTGRSVSLQLVLACWAAGFSAPDGWAQEAGRSLEKAVQELNRSAAEDKVGKTQPRLTTDEVVAAIRGWQRDKVEAADEVYDAYQRIADTLRLPAGARLRYMTTLRAFSNHRFDVWWVHFCIPTGKQAVYAFPIRRRMLRCYPLRTRDAAPVRVENARSVTGAFLAAVRKGDYRAAITLSRPGEFSAEGRAKLKRMFALEQAAIDRAPPGSTMRGRSIRCTRAGASTMSRR